MTQEPRPTPISDGVEARLATTVLLLRDTSAGVEVHMQRRHAEMKFGARAHVFPGGSLDDTDLAPSILAMLGDVDLTTSAARMHMGADGAERQRLCAGLHVCAIRELFEESGVLLAITSDGAPPPLDGLAEARRHVLAGSAFADELRGLALRPQVEALTYGAHFITPRGLPRRFDTHFFLAPAPHHQEALIHAGEAVEGGWFTASAMLDAADRGEAMLMPPTRILLSELRRCACADEAIAGLGSREVASILFSLDGLRERPIPDHLPSVAEVAAYADDRR